MKFRTMFITNSSSTSYIIENKTDEVLTIRDFIRDASFTMFQERIYRTHDLEIEIGKLVFMSLALIQCSESSKNSIFMPHSKKKFEVNITASSRYPDCVNTNRFSSDVWRDGVCLNKNVSF